MRRTKLIYKLFKLLFKYWNKKDVKMDKVVLEKVDYEQ